MHVVGLKIAGFKSFVDPVELAIDEGLTGVVGPNGCGKSNLLEALRWAMGATSARAMRGDDMDDLIFAGSVDRPAREIAEVTIELDNSDRAAPAEYNGEDRIEIRRTLKRGAGSTFRINGRTARAKDVQLLFADASTGANSPALVRQGQISELIGAKPQNRRRILEEAAGIGGLAARRHEAELKLQAADANLGRLSEVMEEVDRQIAQLKRQAQRARRHTQLSHSMTALEAALAAQRWRSAIGDVHTAQGELETARGVEQQSASLAARKATEELTARARVAPVRAEETEAAGRLGALQLQRARIEAEAAAADAALARFDADLARLSADVARETRVREEAVERIDRIAEDRARLPADDPDASLAAEQALQSDLEGARGRRAAAEAAMDSHRAEAARIEAASAAARQRRSEAERRHEKAVAGLAAARAEQDRLSGVIHAASIGDARQRAHAAREVEAAAEARLKAAHADFDTARTAAAGAASACAPAERRVQELDAEISGLDRLLRRIDAGERRPVLAAIDARGLERALAAALDADLDAPADEAAPVHWSLRAGEADSALPAGVPALSGLVAAPAVLRARLVQCGLVDRADGARLQARLKQGQRLVSREGDLWRWDGFVRLAEAPSTAAETLSQMARRAAAALERETGRAAVAELAALRETSAQRLRAAEQALEAARRAAPQASRDAAAARESLLRAEQDVERIRIRIEALAAETSRLETEAAEASTAAAEAAAAISSTIPPDGAGETGRLAAAVTEARDAERRAAECLAETRREREAAARVRATLDRDEAEWRERAAGAGSAISRLAGEVDACQTGRAGVEGTPGRLRAELKRLADDIETADAARRRAADRVASAEADAREADFASRAAREEAAAAREALARTEARLEAALRREAEAAEAARQAFGLELPALEALVASGPESDGPSDEARLQQLRRERDALGAVNLEAEQQLAELTERIDRQAGERADLTAAIAKLREGIEALNGEGRGRLVDAFDAVNEHFKSLFITLFGGGEAELRLTESTDPLDAGLEIFACPPGKRMATLSLMSGGEQALTATALIFAVFLSRPAPICVLDEVDAPLDDANVDRYCRLLDEMRRRTRTRFIVITHNAVSMSRMDRLFGVTMQERGVSRIVSVDLVGAERLAAA